MGAVTSRATDKYIFMAGPHSAGKTAFLYQMKLGTLVETFPSFGFNYESVRVNSVEYGAMDLGGRSRTRALWTVYLKRAGALVFVADAAADADGLAVAREELEALAEMLRVAAPRVPPPVLVLANKQDLDGAMGVGDVSDALGVKDVLRGKPFEVMPVSCVTGEGVEEAKAWLHEQVGRAQLRGDGIGKVGAVENVGEHAARLAGGKGGGKARGGELPFGELADEGEVRAHMLGGVDEMRRRGVVTTESFTQAAMVRVMVSFLGEAVDRSGGRREAVRGIFDAMKDVGEVVGRPMGVTFVYFWLHLVDICVQSAGGVKEGESVGYQALVDEFPLLLLKSMVDAYYSPEVLGKAEAFEAFLPPDLQKFPSVLGREEKEQAS